MSDQATWLTDRALLRISGEDVRPFLQGLITQDMRRLTPAQPIWSGLLSAQGKALFDFLLWDDGDAVLIDCEATAREALARRLSLYRLRRRIDIEPVDGAVHWSREGDRGTPDPRLAALGSRWLGEAGVPADGWRKHRLSLGVPEGVNELGEEKTLWLECNARELGGVAFDKGCFIGQENTARMHYRGKVNRRLVVVPLGPESRNTRTVYPNLERMVELRRIDALGDALRPDWLQAALAEPGAD